MKITDRSDKVEEFDKKYPDLNVMSDSGVIIHVIETIAGPLRIMIDVGEETTSDDLRKAIPLALEWRDSLLEFQGRTGLYSDNSFLASIGEDVSKKARTLRFPYKEVAKGINSLIIDWLRESCNKPNISQPPQYRKMLDFHLSGIEQRIPDPVERCRRLLILLRFSEKRFDKGKRKDKETVANIINQCIRAIKQDESLDSEYPVGKVKLRNTIEWFRRKK